MAHTYERFRFLLNKICMSIPHESILLSGGLDSSILMFYIHPEYAITITIDDSSSDFRYSTLLADRFETKHVITYPDKKAIFEGLNELISDYKTFDPIFIRNAVIQLIGIKRANELRCNSVIVGDGADELFGGYNFLHKYENDSTVIKSKLMQLAQNMDFVSIKMAEKYHMTVFTPFLDKEIIKFAETLDVKEKINKHNGIIYGKFFLRKCFRDALGDEIVWRKKEALEYGSGISQFILTFEGELSDQEFLEGSNIARYEGVSIRNKEHLYYYQIYRKHFNAPINDPSNQCLAYRKCSFCSCSVTWQGSFCKVCGSYPI
jgi:asparagine synthase (glutamine-hydrolysing)